MGKYSQHYLHHPYPPRLRFVHPIWRGIGCFFILLIPIVSFLGARVIIAENNRQHWVTIPQLLRYGYTFPGMGSITVLTILVTIILILIGFGILTVIYSLIYRLFGPPRYGPLDVPPD